MHRVGLGKHRRDDEIYPLIGLREFDDTLLLVPCIVTVEDLEDSRVFPLRIKGITTHSPEQSVISDLEAGFRRSLNIGCVRYVKGKVWNQIGWVFVITRIGIRPGGGRRVVGRAAVTYNALDVVTY